MTKINQLGFFSSEKRRIRTDAEKDWVGMPEYSSQHEPKPKATATFKFETEKECEEFQALLKKHGIFDSNKQIFSRKNDRQTWWPQKNKSTDHIWTSKDTVLPISPVYIISRGRYKKRYTADLLESLKVPYNIVVREDEYKKYKKVVKGRVIVLEKSFIDNYDHFWDDDDERTGPGPARNFVWEHSISEGHKWHWILDDNIEAFMRFNNNLKVKCRTFAPFRAMEEFTFRYENVAMAAPHYSFFIAEKAYYPPFVLNTRLMSCLLIRNDIPFRWRGRYNEDIDISLRILKAGWATIQFNAFLQRKIATQILSGGCTSELYVDGTYLKSKMLRDMHPDVVQVTKRYGREHHYVDYRIFKGNKIKLKSGVEINDEVNEFGMILRKNDKK